MCRILIVTILCRAAVEREEKKSLIAAGINVTDRVFSAEEVPPNGVQVVD